MLAMVGVSLAVLLGGGPIVGDPGPDRFDIQLRGSVGALDVVVLDNHCCVPLPRFATRIEARNADGTLAWSRELEGRFDAAISPHGVLAIANDSQLPGALMLIGPDGSQHDVAAPVEVHDRVAYGDGIALTTRPMYGDGDVSVVGWQVLPGAAPRRLWEHRGPIDQHALALVYGGKVWFETPGHMLTVLSALTGELLFRHGVGDYFSLEGKGGRVFIDGVATFESAASAPPTARVHVIGRVVIGPTTDALLGGIRTPNYTESGGVELRVGDQEIVTDDFGRFELDLVGSGRIRIESHCVGPAFVPMTASRTFRLRVSAARTCDGE